MPRLVLLGAFALSMCALVSGAQGDSRPPGLAASAITLEAPDWRALAMRAEDEAASEDSPLARAAIAPTGFECGALTPSLGLGLPWIGKKKPAPGEETPAEEKPAEKKPKTPKRKAVRERTGPALSAERARILLRSLTIPGWGQATLGQRRTAGLFFLAETGVWGSYLAFRIQEHLRRDSYLHTAQLIAGIDLRSRDEEFHRIVGSFLSSDEYNLYVVSRDAANLYYDQPDLYWAYIHDHEIKGSDVWTWPDVSSLLRYRAQRKDAQRASLRANTALACAIGNRLLSMVHAARAAGKAPPAEKTSWQLEVSPVDGEDPTAFRFGLRATF